MSQQFDYTPPADEQIPDSHQATWRPGPDGPVRSIEPVPAKPEVDLTEPTVVQAQAQHEQTTRELSKAEAKQLSDAWAAEHQRQLEAIRALEVELAGDPTNLDAQGRPHFLRMTQTAENPPAWAEVCGTCETVWPCQVYRDMHMVDEDASATTEGDSGGGVQ